MFLRVCSLAALMSLALSPGLAATTSGPGKINNLIVLRANVGIIDIAGGTVTGTWPLCATLHRYTINTSTAAGQAVWATILSARMSNSTVVIYGTGACDDWGDSEGINHVDIVP